MSFTLVTITGAFVNSDDSPASGTLCATLSASLSNDGIEQSQEPVCGLLDPTGSLIAQNGKPFTLCATDDAGTIPQGYFYIFTLNLDGQSVVEFNAPVLNANNPITFVQLQDNAV